MNNISVQASSELMVALRIRFTALVGDKDNVLMEFSDPYRRFAVSSPVGPEDLPLLELDAEDEFYFLFIPSGSATAYDLQKKSEQWIGQPAIEIVTRSDRILWRPGRAMMQGSPERLEETLLALADFSFYEGELRKLEKEIETDWKIAEADIRLTHGVDETCVKRWSHVNDMTHRSTLRRMRFARLERHLEKASITLTGPARRLVSELGLQTEVTDRLKSVDDRLEVYEDLYELANDRISEYSYFRKEYKLEFWIILLLVLEVVVMAWELYVTWGR